MSNWTPTAAARRPSWSWALATNSSCDDGVGVVAARRLADHAMPGVDVLDGGTLGLMLMPYIAGRQAVLVLDAVSEAAPGTG